MRIGLILKKWRAMSELDLQAAAVQMGIGATTLRRIEAGVVPDGTTLLKLMGWLFSDEPQPIVTEVQIADEVNVSGEAS
jgi:hypothetical protein